MARKFLWQDLRPGDELTIIKTHYTSGRPDYSYPARMIESDHPGWFAFEATWALSDMDVDGILYETGGVLIEYFSPEKHFNIFHVFRRTGETSGYYANVTELPVLAHDETGRLTLRWIDCWLDVIKLPNGNLKLLDEDELVASGVETSSPELGQKIRHAADEAIATLSTDEWPV